MANLQFKTRCAEELRQKPCSDSEILTVFGGIIRQGVDCRSHFGDGGSGSPPIYDWGRDENTGNIGIDSARLWTKIGHRVSVRLFFGLIFGDSFFSPTQPAYIYIGFLPFRRNPFTIPPGTPNTQGVLGTGSVSIFPSSTTQAITSNYTVKYTVMADWQPRTVDEFSSPINGMTFGPTNGAFLILTNITGTNGPPPGQRLTGSIEFEYFADSEDIQAPGYVCNNPLTPGTQCSYPTEYQTLATPTFLATPTTCP